MGQLVRQTEQWITLLKESGNQTLVQKIEISLPHSCCDIYTHTQTCYGNSVHVLAHYPMEQGIWSERHSSNSAHRNESKTPREEK